MIPIHIQIGKVRTLEVENWQVIPDDRQETIEVIGGKIVQDFGHVIIGDKISCIITILKADWEVLRYYWDERLLVEVTDEAGNNWGDMRVVVKSYSYIAYFPKAYKVNLELWRI